MIKSVKKALKILTLLSNGEGEPVSLSEIALKTNLPKPTCSHIISTLTEEGYTVKVSSSKGYILGPSSYYLSRHGRYGRDLITICRPIMNYVAEKCGYSVVLTVIEGSKKYIIDYIDDGTIFDTKASIIEDNIYRSATGRIMLTNLSDNEIYDVFKKYGPPKEREWQNTDTLEAFMKKIRIIKNADIEKSRIPNEKYGFVNLGYGSPVYDNKGCVAALGIAMKFSFEEEELFEKNDEEKLKNLLIKSSKEISRRLKYK